MDQITSSSSPDVRRAIPITTSNSSLSSSSDNQYVHSNNNTNDQSPTPSGRSPTKPKTGGGGSPQQNRKANNKFSLIRLATKSRVLGGGSSSTSHSHHTKSSKKTQTTHDIGAELTTGHPSTHAPTPGTPTSNAHTKIFGQPLAVAIQRSAKSHPLLPDLVFKCLEYLKLRGSKEEGIFRISGSAAAISKVREEFDNGVDVDLSTQLDHHVVSGILKLYLRQIPETVFNEQFPDELEELREGGNSSDAINMRIERITQLLKQLPESNRCIIHHLCSLLNTVSFEPATKMNTVNLAIIFAPTLGCPVEVMTVLIDYYEPIFSQQTYDYN
ncbi:hypothetical protein SAMD00019534_023810 [Acytostelium subglobosum LB1]|uniref:hypothetical protein n=1 Tax=Acytostelium subglobosum LB1 TaxID=1410327 RepID=UPI000644A46C|nr:hypothetical protein SAMD00019534_023810 [Acytostelium subglobosum LB1]GAM19206.1 hypothetical protein SAMD00019534_023810 [Acytostelium subglobosum LB1]|eukprot:XP_012757133.1 hypothetical protein SAMD00019534_023810 [Acytostelium subglobosum LB1]